MIQQGDGSTESILFYGGVVLLLLLLSYYLLRRQRHVAAARENADDQSEYGQAASTWNLGAWLKRQGEALRERLVSRAPRHFGTDTVHDLYKNLLLFGDEHGLARPQEKTPYEYLAPLCHHYPQRKQDFLTLTDAYVAAHYGEHHFPADALESLQQAWQRIASEPSPESPT